MTRRLSILAALAPSLLAGSPARAALGDAVQALSDSLPRCSSVTSTCQCVSDRLYFDGSCRTGDELKTMFQKSGSEYLGALGSQQVRSPSAVVLLERGSDGGFLATIATSKKQSTGVERDGYKLDRRLRYHQIDNADGTTTMLFDVLDPVSGSYQSQQKVEMYPVEHYNPSTSGVGYCIDYTPDASGEGCPVEIASGSMDECATLRDMMLPDYVAGCQQTASLFVAQLAAYVTAPLIGDGVATASATGASNGVYSYAFFKDVVGLVKNGTLLAGADASAAEAAALLCDTSAAAQVDDLLERYYGCTPPTTSTPVDGFPTDGTSGETDQTSSADCYLEISGTAKWWVPTTQMCCTQDWTQVCEGTQQQGQTCDSTGNCTVYEGDVACVGGDWATEEGCLQ
jgi:hypothetical protein